MLIRPHLIVPDASLNAICLRNHVRELSLFGSSARGDFRPDSDVDLLVDFQPGAIVGFLELAGLQEELSDLLHCKVDLVPKGGLKPLIRGAVLAEARLLYAA